MPPRFRPLLNPSFVAGFTFISVLTPAALTPAMAQNPAVLIVTVDGRPVDFGGAAPAQVGGRTLVPLRAIFEALGAQVDFNAGTIRARRGETQLQLALGSTQATVNGAARVLDVPAQSVFGRTLVPLRFVGEAFNALVNFNAATGTIAIVSTGPAAGTAAPGGGDNAGVPYTVPGSGQSVSGTLAKIDLSPPATVTLAVNGALQTFALGDNPLALRQISLATSATATPVRQPARQIALTSLAAGDPVRLSLGADNRVAQITSTATVIVARVQFAGNNQIVLDDDRDTTLTVGPALRFVDAAGRVSTNPSNLAPGASIALFLSRESRAIYQVSAFAPDFTPATGAVTPIPVAPIPATTLPGTTLPGTTLPPVGGLDPLPTGALPAVGAPQIQLVTHNASAPLRAGSRLEVSVRATPGLRATFSLGTKIQNVALTEDPTRRGVYSGSYTVKAGDDVLTSRVLARVVGADGTEDFAQSQQTATIDTIAPRLVGTFPATGAQITVAQPNIAIFADDLGGSGLGEARIDLISNGVTTRIPATVAPPTSVNAVAPTPLSGLVNVRAVITDKAGNPLNVNFNFNVGAGTGDISSFSHGANRASQPGDDVPLVMDAAPAGRATFDVISGRNQTISKDVPLIETEPGRYRATYRIPTAASGNLRFVGKFITADGTTSQLETTTRVQLTAAPTKLTIQTPADGDQVKSPLTVTGQAAPGATIDVALSATGMQLFILEYKQDLGVQQVRADANGAWTVRVDLPAPRNVSGLRYVISATQTDAAGKVGDPVVVTVAR